MAESPNDQLYWRLDTLHHTAPLSRWASEVLVDQRTDAARQLFEARGVPLGAIAWTELDGYIYVAAAPLGGSSWGPVGIVAKAKAKVTGGFAGRIELMREVARTNVHRDIVDDWVAGGEQRLLDQGYRFHDFDLFSLSDKELRKQFANARAYVTEAVQQHVLLQMACAHEVGRLSLRLTRDHEFNDEDLDRLLAGKGSSATGAVASAEHLVDLIMSADAGDTLRTASSLDALSAISPGVAGAVASHLAKWSRDAVRNDPAHPVVADEQLRLLDQLTEIVDSVDVADSDDRTHSLQALENRMLAAVGDTPVSHQRLERARRARPIITGSRTATLGIPLAVLRDFGKVIGVRLVGTGKLSEEEHVFDLTMDEAEAALRGSKKAPAEAAALAAGRYTKRLNPPNPPRASVGEPLAPVADSGLPNDVIEQISAILWHLEHWLWSSTTTRPGRSEATTG